MRINLEKSTELNIHPAKTLMRKFIVFTQSSQSKLLKKLRFKRFASAECAVNVDAVNESAAVYLFRLIGRAELKSSLKKLVSVAKILLALFYKARLVLSICNHSSFTEFTRGMHTFESCDGQHRK